MPGTPLPSSRKAGAVVTLEKRLSEADIALFALVTSDGISPTEESPQTDRRPREAAPAAMLAALLAAAAARHATYPHLARFISQSARIIEPAYTDDLVTVTARLAAYQKATGEMRVVARCEGEDGRALAEGEMVLYAD